MAKQEFYATIRLVMSGTRNGKAVQYTEAGARAALNRALKGARPDVSEFKIGDVLLIPEGQRTLLKENRNGK